MNNQLNRRHNSVFNPTDTINLLSPQKSHANSNNSSVIHHSNTNIPNMSGSFSNNNSYLKTNQNLRSNSLFAYQEYDNFSFLGNTNPNTEILQNIHIPLGDPQGIYSSKNDSESSSESEQSNEEPEFKPVIKNDKRRSDGMIFSNFRNCLNNTHVDDTINNNIAGINHPNNMIHMANATPTPANIYGNFNMSPVKMMNNINNFRRYSQAYPVPFTIMNTMPQQNMRPSGFKDKQNIPLSPMPIPVYQNFSQCNRPYDDQYLLSNLSTLLLDQNGCRQVQNKLEEKKSDLPFMKQFFHLLEPYLLDIINDRFGNYVMQKFFEILIAQHNGQIISDFFSKIRNDLFNISVNTYGTRFFQKSLEKLDNDNYSYIETQVLNDIFKQLIEKHLFALCYDKNGNHVFQKLLKIYPKKKNEFIFHELNKYAIDISKLKQGVIILQTVFKYADQTQKDTLINKIIAEIELLINDEYGNYVITEIVQSTEREYNELIFEYITKNIVSLSKRKFSSNVLDKCITADDKASLDLIQHVIDLKLVRELIVDQYGNYFIQKALNITSGPQFMAIIHQIEPVLDSLINTPIGKKIYDHLMQKFGDYFQNSMINKTNTNSLNKSNNNSNFQTPKPKRKSKDNDR